MRGKNARKDKINMVRPDYYDKFKCISSECKHNCCKGGWEIEIDDESFERFSKVPGDFGKRIKDAINDDHIFIHKNGHCPLLAEDGRCEMVLNGIDLCVICDEYPRFTEYFDDYAERGISLSCEAAADIILDNKNKFKLIYENDGECSEPIFKYLFSVREKIFKILTDRSKNIFSRMRIALDYGRYAQERINENEYGEFIYEPKDMFSHHIPLTDFADLLKDLPSLNSEWKDMLNRITDDKENKTSHTSDEIVAEQLAVYFVYRYFLKAAFDYDAFSKLRFAFLSVMTIIALENSIGNIKECARLYSIEIEHSEENIESIYDEFLFGDEYSFENTVNMIS